MCAGVLGTNTLLLREAIRIADGSLVNLNLDAGRGIKDHTNLRVNVKSSKKIGSLNEINASFLRKAWLAIRHAIGMWTLMRGTGSTATANIDIDGDGVVDTRINLLRFFEAGRMGTTGKLFASSSPGFSISITQINPKSYGSLKLLKSELLLEPNYLSDTFDIEHLKLVLDSVVRLLGTPPLSHFVDSIENIEVIKNTPEKYIIENTYSGYHLIGGCASLLGKNFEVGRYKNLFACDASAIEEYPSSNIHSTIVILADLCARKFISLQ